MRAGASMTRSRSPFSTAVSRCSAEPVPTSGFGNPTRLDGSTGGQLTAPRDPLVQGGQVAPFAQPLGSGAHVHRLRAQPQRIDAQHGVSPRPHEQHLKPGAAGAGLRCRPAHLHLHVVPRTKGDGLRGFFWPRTKYAEGEAAAILAVATATATISAKQSPATSHLMPPS